MLHMLELRY